MSEPIRLMEFMSAFAVGGTERQFMHLMRGLDRTRFDLHIACLRRWGALLDQVDALNAPVVEFPIPNLYSYATAREQIRFTNYLRRRKIELVHAYGFAPNVFMIPAAKFAGGCTTVASVRDIGVYLTPAKIRLQMIACRLADCVLVNSNAVRDWLIAGGVQERKIQVIYNGIAVSPLRAPLRDFPVRREFNIDANAPLITVVCRLAKLKGIEIFLEAAVTVLRRFPEARALIVGESFVDPEYKSRLEAHAASLGLASHVIFTGQRHDVLNILQEANVSVLPSLSESLSNSLIEAMAAGLPVIATQVGGNAEAVLHGSTGILIPPGDADALSHAIIRVLESPQLARQLGAAGHERVLRTFSIDSMIQQTEDLFASLIHRKKFTRSKGNAAGEENRRARYTSTG